MAVLIVVDSAPYGSEGPYNAFRLADALALREEHVGLFLMGDGVDVACCGICCTARGLTDDAVVPGVRIETIHDLAAATARCDRVASF